MLYNLERIKFSGLLKLARNEDVSRVKKSKRNLRNLKERNDIRLKKEIKKNLIIKNIRCNPKIFKSSKLKYILIWN